MFNNSSFIDSLKNNKTKYKEQLSLLVHQQTAPYEKWTHVTAHFLVTRINVILSSVLHTSLAFSVTNILFCLLVKK